MLEILLGCKEITTHKLSSLMNLVKFSYLCLYFYFYFIIILFILMFVVTVKLLHTIFTNQFTEKQLPSHPRKQWKKETSLKTTYECITLKCICNLHTNLITNVLACCVCVVSLHDYNSYFIPFIPFAPLFSNKLKLFHY